MIDNFDELLNKAYNLHISNKLQEAKIIYEKLLEVYFDNNNLLNLYAQLLVCLKEYENALKYFTILNSRIVDKSIIINTAKVYLFMENYLSAIDTLKIVDNTDYEVLKLLSSCYLKLQKLDDAIEVLNRLVNINQENFVDLYNLSYCYFKSGKIDNSLKYALIAYKVNPNDIDIIRHLAMLYEELNDAENELKYLDILSSLVKDVNILEKCGLLAKKLSNVDLALAYFNEILKIDSENLSAVTNIAIIYEEIDKSISYELYKEIVQNEGKSEFYIIKLFNLANEMHLYSEALEYSKILIEFDKNNANYYHLCAMSLYNLNEYVSAKEYYKKAIEISPDIDYLWVYYARVLAALFEDGEAMNILAEHLETKNAKRDYLELKLRNRDFNSVKDLYYEFHTKIKEFDEIKEKANFSFYNLNLKEKYNITEEEFNKNIKEYSKNNKNEFNKEYSSKIFKFPINSDAKLLIFSLHGAGDYIMFLRYLPQVKKIFKEIILSVPDSMVELVKYNFPEFRIIPSSQKVNKEIYDVAIPIFCLNYLLNSDFTSIPETSGYLRMNKTFSNNLIFETNKKKIGIFWFGNPSILHNRAASLEDFLPLINNQNNMIYSFQIENKGKCFNEISQRENFVDLSTYIKNYTDTAIFLKNIDVLVTIDTSIAHLAGALGIKTYLMLPYEAEWRWFFDENVSSWYDSVRIFRQKKAGDWSGVIKEIENELNYDK